MLDASRVFRSSVRSWRGSAAKARSNTVVSIDMVSGSYAARPMPAAQSMLALPGIPSICQLWSEGLLQLRPQKSIFLTRRNFARARNEARGPSSAVRTHLVDGTFNSGPYGDITNIYAIKGCPSPGNSGSYYVHAIGLAVLQFAGRYLTMSPILNLWGISFSARDLFHERYNMTPYCGLRYSHERFREPQAV